MTITTALVILIAVSMTVGPRIELYFARRAGVAKVEAWYSAARQYVVPDGTLLYDETPAAIAAAKASGSPGRILTARRMPNGRLEFSVHHDQQFPLLQWMSNGVDGVPMLMPLDILYVHEHLTWDVPKGSRPALLVVRYICLDGEGRPSFMTLMYGPTPLPGTTKFPAIGGTATPRDPPGRSLANLRIYAGRPSTTDPSRFALPFDCDSGHGRFEFQTDTDVTDGGKGAPDVWIEWDDAPTTAPATQPSTRGTGSSQ